MENKEVQLECDWCFRGYLVRKYNSKTGAPFYGCNRYPKCKHTVTVRQYDERFAAEIIGDIDDNNYDAWYSMQDY